jgi:uncharacterized membrane protein
MMMLVIAFVASLLIEAACKAFGSVAVFAFAVGTVLVAGVILACVQIVNFNKTQNRGLPIKEE